MPHRRNPWYGHSDVIQSTTRNGRGLRDTLEVLSCERLFSVFGNTLTELRNRLGTDTLTTLMEIKMHVRDEHVRKKTKDRVKCQFAARGVNIMSPPEPTSEITQYTSEGQFQLGLIQQYLKSISVCTQIQ